MITVPMMLNDDKELGTVRVWRRDAAGNHGRVKGQPYIYDAQLIVLSRNGKEIIHDLHTTTRHEYGRGSIFLVTDVFRRFAEIIAEKDGIWL